MILPSSSTLSCSPSTHVWLNSSVCLEQKIQGKIKELSQMTLVSSMNTNFQTKNDSARCGVTDFGGKMPRRSCFFYDNVVAAKVCSRSCNPLSQKYERERERRGRVNEEYTIPCSLMCCCHKPRWPLALLTTVMLWK